jgi:S-disulfanyl-L-cysteine oxidoreductase SoxD
MKFKIVGAIAALYGLLAAETSRSVWDGVYTDAQAKRGQPAYNEHCGSCHGPTLGGGESAPPLAGGDFLSNWNGLTAGDLFERIRTTMPLNKPRTLSREVYADVLAYMLSVNRFPPGNTELPRATEFLREIRIDSSKPDK